MTTYELARCVVCGGADTDDIAGPDDIRREAELLWQFSMRRLSPTTPPPRLADRVAFSQDYPWRVVRCRACGCVYRNPAEKPSALRATYAGEEVSRDVLAALHATQRRSFRPQVRRLRRYLRRRGTGLEVGSYVGAFLAAAREARWPFEGLDVNANASAFARSLGFVVHDGDLEHFTSDHPFDAVVIWNTFEQLPDPRAALRTARALLREGGVLALRVPNGECYARWSRGLRSDTAPVRALRTASMAYNNLLTFPYRVGFTPASLTRLVEDVGFSVRAIVPDVLVPTADEWTRAWARLEERLLKPLTRRWTPWFELYATRRDG